MEFAGHYYQLVGGYEAEVAKPAAPVVPTEEQEERDFHARERAGALAKYESLARRTAPGPWSAIEDVVRPALEGPTRVWGANRDFEDASPSEPVPEQGRNIHAVVFRPRPKQSQ